MSDLTKLTDDELVSIKNLREQVAGSISLTGQLKLSHAFMEEELSTIESKLAEQITLYKELLSKEKQLIDDLLKKYGIGSLDIDTGIFTPENK